VKPRRKKSDRVDRAIARMYAKMAQAAARTAVAHAVDEQWTRANIAADHARVWLEMAGADATRDYFNLPA
jgi:uncharacterized Zn-finger protein